MKKAVRRSWFARLMDIDDRSVSSTNLYVFAVTLIGIILLLVPSIVLLIEVFHNYTITTDLSGMAAYIGSVATLFASAGITKAWTSYTYSKKDFRRKFKPDENFEEIDCPEDKEENEQEFTEI